MDSVELKPCPFCGSNDLAILKGGPALHDAIKCRPCNLFVPLTVDEWNRRLAVDGGRACEKCGMDLVLCCQVCINALSHPAPDNEVRVPVEMLERWELLFQTGAEYGITSHYPTGEQTPNGQLQERAMKDIHDMLAAAQSAKQRGGVR